MADVAPELLASLPPEVVERLSRPTLGATLGITFVELTRERVVARMPVEPRVHQPFGLLHGGASVALAESVASVGAWLNVDREREAAVGLEINANHVRGKRDGVVTATATPAHVGRTTQVWDVRITDEAGRLVCVSRCTVAVVPAAGAGEASARGGPRAAPAGAATRAARTTGSAAELAAELAAEPAAGAGEAGA